jgi:hypothetical protein
VAGAYTGFNSQPWKDNDPGSTRILFANCRIDAGGAPDTFSSVRIELRKIRDSRPDLNAGERTLNCFNYDQGDWGNQQRDFRYKFRINLINGTACCYSLNANPVEIRW